MRIYTRVEYEWAGDIYVPVYADGFDHDGEVTLCKGDSLAKQQESQQIAFNAQLMDIFNKQFASQQEMLTYLKGKLQPMVDNPTGYSDEALTAMRTSATDTLSQNYENAKQALGNRAVQLNQGSDLPSGTQEQLNAALLQSEATDKSNAQNTLTLNNENLKQSNYWNALNILNGQSANQYNPLGYATAYNQGSDATANLSQAVTASQQSGFLGALGGIVGGGLSAAGSIWCPAEGSKYLMADGTEKLVQDLVVGDQLLGIDGGAQTITEIQSGVQDISRVTTADGYVTRNSVSHTFALPKGGFTESSKSLGKTIATATGTGVVIGVEKAGKARVYNVITDGSHSYRADGVWALGASEAERQVRTIWPRLKNQMTAEVA